MTPRELLELAAKSVGYKYIAHHLGRDSFVVYKEECYSEVHERCVTSEKTLSWNPLADDGDALRLAVSQRLKIAHNPPEDQNLWVAVRDRRFVACSIERFDDESQRSAATRRAITRAAAEIGMAMK